MEIGSLTTPEQVATASRSRLYRLVADGLLYPDKASFAALTAGNYQDEIRATSADLPYELPARAGALVASGTYTDFQAHYLRLFEVGTGMPPCPLYGGLYRGGRKAVMEELTRFYNFFGLSIEAGAGELPDHIVTELEFMHFLTFKELTALSKGEDPAPYRRAQADFLERQLTSWLPALEARIERLDPPAFYMALVRLTNALSKAERAYLQPLIAASDAVEVET